MSTTLSPPRNRLIPSARVAGTAVYDTRGERLGHIDDVMIDKPTGRIAYAVLSFGGFLGFGDKHHPLPWSTLRYDTALDGYVVDLDRELLKGAPSLQNDQAWDTVDDYYGTSAVDAEMPLDPTIRP